MAAPVFDLPASRPFMGEFEAKRLATEIDAFDGSRRFIASPFKIYQGRYIVEVWDRIDHEKHTIRSRGEWQRLREGVQP